MVVARHRTRAKRGERHDPRGRGGDGRLVEWEICNRPAKGVNNGLSHFAVKAVSGGKLLDARALCGEACITATVSVKPKSKGSLQFVVTWHYPNYADYWSKGKKTPEGFRCSSLRLRTPRKRWKPSMVLPRAGSGESRWCRPATTFKSQKGSPNPALSRVGPLHAS